jgi:hypothetical protein
MDQWKEVTPKYGPNKGDLGFIHSLDVGMNGGVFAVTTQGAALARLGIKFSKGAKELSDKVGTKWS